MFLYLTFTLFSHDYSQAHKLPCKFVVPLDYSQAIAVNIYLLANLKLKHINEMDEEIKQSLLQIYLGLKIVY